MTISIGNGLRHGAAIIQGHEWDGVERGLKQRLKALNLFISDIYNEQQIINDGIIPSDILLSSRDFGWCKGVDLNSASGRTFAARTSFVIMKVAFSCSRTI